MVDFPASHVIFFWGRVMLDEWFLIWNQEQQIASKIAAWHQGSKQGICDKSAWVANTTAGGTQKGPKKRCAS